MTEGVEDTELNSPDSSAEDKTIQDAATDTAADDDAGSSAASTEGVKDLLSVVRDAVPPRKDPASPAAGENSDQPKADASDKKGTEPDNENFSDVPFHKHPRFQQLVTERNQFREGAQQYDQVQNFLRQNGVTAEEAAEILEVRAMMKRDPAKAWEVVKPLVHQLLIDAGKILPQDLQQQVAQNQISQAAALEISRLRALAASQTKAVEQDRARAEENAKLDNQKAIYKAIGDREIELRRTDPDFESKMDDVQRELAWVHRRDGPGDTPQKALQQLNDAVEAVNKRHKAAASQQRMQQKRPITGGRVAGGNQAAAKPTSMLDVVQMGRAG